MLHGHFINLLGPSKDVTTKTDIADGGMKRATAKIRALKIDKK